MSRAFLCLQGIAVFSSLQTVLCQEDMFSLEDCVAALTVTDANDDGGLSFGEFFVALSTLTTYDDCPEFGAILFPSSAFRDAFEELVCACLDYPSVNPAAGSYDGICCNEVGVELVRLPSDAYPHEYTSMLCETITAALLKGCEPPGPPTNAPSNEPSDRPTISPSRAPWQTPSLQPSQPPMTISTSIPVASNSIEEPSDQQSVPALSGIWNFLAIFAFVVCGIAALLLIALFIRG